MSFEQDNGYTPRTFEQFMESLRLGVNAQWQTTYDSETFIGTNWYKHFYPLVQEALKNETKSGEIFSKLQEFIASTNEEILRPTVSYPGLLDAFQSEGYIASLRPPAGSLAGYIGVCVDTDESVGSYPEVRLHICGLLKDYVVAGMVFQGTEFETLTLTNGQNFQFGYYLPDRIPILLRLTAHVSENTLLTIPDDTTLRGEIFNSINQKYKLGLNFEPGRYANVDDFPWAGSVVLQYSIDGGDNWLSSVADLNFDDLYTFGLEDIQIIVVPS